MFTGNQVFGIVSGVLLIDHDIRATHLDLNATEQILETINFQVLTAYCNMLFILTLAKVVSCSISTFHNSYRPILFQVPEFAIT